MRLPKPLFAFLFIGTTVLPAPVIAQDFGQQALPILTQLMGQLIRQQGRAIPSPSANPPLATYPDAYDPGAPEPYRASVQNDAYAARAYATPSPFSLDTTAQFVAQYLSMQQQGRRVFNAYATQPYAGQNAGQPLSCSGPAAAAIPGIARLVSPYLTNGSFSPQPIGAQARNYSYNGQYQAFGLTNQQSIPVLAQLVSQYMLQGQ
ncbi:hypothetical protein [Anthocerotibacter panamensis]|uniref:hypothetical protein n=1 Tax=Anthocerotibacter panamensis TaxID=2857077 RepID=UPI001C407645|nr:hypothetical protein [Anthocerotibacter panamensis]